MNSRQKELHQLFLDNEKAVLKKIEANYQDALFEIDDKIERLLARDDADLQNVIYQIEYQKSLKSQIQSILDTLHNNEFETVSEYLAKSYEDGFIGTMYDLQGQGIPLVIPIDQEQVVAALLHETKLSEGLYAALGKDIKRLSKQIAGEISRGISNNATYNEIARNIANMSNIPKNNAMRIARTEAHRIQCKATADAQWKAKEKGADVVKQWDASLDGKTRSTHRELDGQVRELHEPFEVGGYKPMQPGDFGVPSEDCNCRCDLLSRARWALGNDFTKWDQETGGLVKIKAKDYDSFKMKYEKTSDRVRSNVQKINTLENSGKSSKMELEKKNSYAKAGHANAGVFVDIKDDLFTYAKKIKPIKGYDDFVCHATPDVFLIYDGDYEMQYTPKEFAELIRQSKDFHNKPIRIISCQAGAKADGAAKQLANELGVNVLAPTETVTVDHLGRMFISDNDVLAEMWDKASDEEKKLYKETGEWKVFEPDRKG